MPIITINHNFKVLQIDTENCWLTYIIYTYQRVPQ